MKKNIFILGLASLLTVSCGDGFLTTNPTAGVSTELALNTEKNLDNAVNGLYDLMSSNGYYGGAMFYYGDMKGDDLQSSYNSGRNCNSCYLFNHTSTSLRAGSLWGRPFYIIRNAWNVINAIDQGKAQGSEERLKELKGEAMAVMALCQFDLTRCFGYPYTKDKGVGWGAPLVDHAITLDENPPRSTVAQDYDFIIKTLEDAIPLMSKEKNNGRMNAYGARALLSRVYLYHDDNEKAFQMASSLIEEIEGNGAYRLYSRDEYIPSWNLQSKFGSESLFEIANSTDDNEGRNSLAYLMHWSGYREMFATKKFVDEMFSDPNDIRCELLEQQVYNQNDVWWLKKWPGTDATTPSFDNNYVIFRLSEVYLIAAEAGVKLGGASAAKGLTYLNAIVQRANPDKSVTLAEYTLDRVLEERSKELIGEGHRFFDMLRNGKTIIRKGGYHLPNIVEEVNWDYYKCVLPIPTDQFTFSPDMEQNPGYTKN